MPSRMKGRGRYHGRLHREVALQALAGQPDITPKELAEKLSVGERYARTLLRDARGALGRAKPGPKPAPSVARAEESGLAVAPASAGLGASPPRRPTPERSDVSDLSRWIRSFPDEERHGIERIVRELESLKRELPAHTERLARIQGDLLSLPALAIKRETPTQAEQEAIDRITRQHAEDISHHAALMDRTWMSLGGRIWYHWHDSGYRSEFPDPEEFLRTVLVFFKANRDEVFELRTSNQELSERLQEAEAVLDPVRRRAMIRSEVLGFYFWTLLMGVPADPNALLAILREALPFERPDGHDEYP